MKWQPEDYAKNSTNQLEWARELIAGFNLAGTEAVLDVGCGDGKITAEIALALPQGFVMGVDRSTEFVNYARQHYPPPAYPNLRFEQMDARQLVSDRQFDLIFSNAALHWLEDHPAFLAGCARLLKPEGRLVLSCGGKGNAATIFAVMGRLIQKPHWQTYFTGFAFPYYFYAPADYERWLPESGLRAVRLELVAKEMIHQGGAGLAGWIRSTWLPYTQCLPEALQEQFIMEAVDDYVREYPLSELEQCRVPMVRLEVEARLNGENKLL